MRNYVQAYRDVFGSGFLREGAIKKHVDRHIKLDAMLPDFASFFYVIELPTQKYHFMGRHQINVSGFSNEEFMERGIELFLSRVHPEDATILLDKIYPSHAQIIADCSESQRTEIQLQYNYRFKPKGVDYRNLMEQVYVLELDDTGGPALVLGNVIELDSKGVLPIRFVCKRINEFGCPEIIHSETLSSGVDQIDALTRRELEILCKLAHGKSSREIGDMLCISRHTVDTHRRNLLKKVGCKSVVELVRIAFNNGLL